jgi:hypothetical protein
MNDETKASGRLTAENNAELEHDYTEIEIGQLNDAEYEMANLRHEMFLEKERAERETLDREFEEELDQLFATIKAGDGQTAE